MRRESELAKAVSEWGWVYHHMGIPTSDFKEGEVHIPHLGMFVSGFPDSEFGIEWMRFEKDSIIHPLVQQLPHLAFVVPDVKMELEKRNFEVLTPVNEPMEGLQVAMILHNGCPVELMSFSEVWISKDEEI